MEANGDYFRALFAIVGLLASLLAVSFSETVRPSEQAHWGRFLEQVIVSVELAVCGWGCSSYVTSSASPYPWILFPLISLMTGCGKSLYDSCFGATVSPAGIIGGAIFFIGFSVLGFYSWELHGKSFLVTLSGSFILLCSLSSVKRDLRLPSTEPYLLFTPPRNGYSAFFRNAFNYVISNERERKLASFLLLTGAVMILELLYGISANSLGLISDSFHMMLDSTSIAIGLCAAFAASLPCDAKTHPFGYARYEVLGGFINGVLLLYIALYVIVESVERIISPPAIEAAYLIHVSVVGLLVNVVGIVFFHEGHGHSHSHGECAGLVDHNLRGVYLHILADLLGSVSVMISSILIAFTGMRVADPICSVLSSAFIAISAFPLLEETGRVLLLSSQPYNSDDFFQKSVSAIKEVSGVTTVDSFCAWSHSTAPRESTYCAIRLSTHSLVDHSNVRRSVKHCMKNILLANAGTRRAHVIVHVE
ncbi:cation transporter protein [Trypanosoma grayi]|uniref:cation transporter protein n=1 Tax=Trypanosoma grayi TaxID=71804 RepID=UPI0004F3FE13|nr:cation transporter protein [Trypanosoma grayi]KEG06844.1 cation transporter protein [Trypanosoma grayi]